MRYLVTILFFFIAVNLFAQKPDSKTLEKAVKDFDKALVSKDSMQLKVLLSNELSYGHSTGWLQTKKEVIGDLFNGKLTYSVISPKSPNIIVNGNVASVRMYAEIDAVMDSKPMQLKLNVLQVWIWKNKHWELFARQSAKA